MTKEKADMIEKEAEAHLESLNRADLSSGRFATTVRDNFIKQAYIAGRTVGIDRIKELEDGLRFIEDNYGNHDEVRTKIQELLNK